MKFKYIHFFVCFFMLFFFRCGLPDLDVPINIGIPKNLTVKKNLNGTLNINFVAYNPEKDFVGYNVYIARDSKYEILQALSNHVKNQKIEEAVQEKYIVKNGFFDYPTIEFSSFSKQVLKEPTIINFVLKKGPSNQQLFYPLYIGITAIVRSKNSESEMSEIIYVE